MSLATKVQRGIDTYIGSLLCILASPFTPRAQDIGTPKRILIVKLWAVGESILVLPFIHALKKQYPQAEIDVFTRARNATVFTDNRDIAQLRILENGGFKGGRRAYDLVFDTEPFFKLSALISFYFGRQTIGFDHGLRSLLYSRKVHYNDTQHVVLTYLDFMEAIGQKTEAPTHLVELPFSKADEQAALDSLTKAGVDLKAPLIGICATSAESAHSRLWPKERFA